MRMQIYQYLLIKGFIWRIIVGIFILLRGGYEKRVFTNQELIDEFIDLNTFDHSYGFVCGKLVRKDLSDNIAFNEMTTLGEDMEYWLKLYLISNKVVYVNRDSYILSCR